MRLRRLFERFDDYDDQPFDQQVWPVTIALGVVCFLAIGAIATLLDDAWMWTMLLLLPALAAAAHFALLQLDDSRLKTSLQLAALTSLSIHLLILIATSAISIFKGPEPLPIQKVVQRRSRTIEVTRRSNPFPWQKVVSQPIPEPDIKVEKQATSQTDVKPQIVPTVQSTHTRKPQLVRQNRTRKSVPRFSKTMSELKRSIINTTAQTDPVRPKPQPIAPTMEPAANRQQKSVADATGQLTSSATQPTTSSNTQTVQRKPVESSAMSEASGFTAQQPVENKAQSDQQVQQPPLPTAIAKQTDLAAAARRPTAFKKRPRDIVPLPTSAKRMTTSQTAKQPNARQSELSAAAGKVTRRPQQSDITSIAPIDSVDRKRSSTSELARSVRKETDVLTPTISTPEATSIEPKRSTSPSLIDVTVTAKDSPSRRPGSRSQAKTLKPKPTALSRSTKGTSGIGTSNNVSDATGGLATPLPRASDSAKRERELNLPNLDHLMATSRRTNQARIVASSSQPTSSLRADTTKWTLLSGARKPKEQSLESAAARVDSALAINRDRIAAAKGEASADLGKTKVVFDQASKRRSGGGMPDFGPTKTELTKRSSETADVLPSLMAAVSIETASTASRNSQPTRSDELRPDELAKMETHRGGEALETMDFVSAIISSAKSDSGENPFARLFSDQRSDRTLAGDPISRLIEEILEEELEKLAAGNRKTSISQALLVDSQAEPVFTDSQKNRSAIDETETGDANLLSDSLMGKIARRTIAPSSALGTATTKLMMTAATSLPLIQPSESTPADRVKPKGNGHLADLIQAVPQSDEATAQVTPHISSLSNLATRPADAATESVADGSINVLAKEMAILEDVRTNRLVRAADFRLDLEADTGPAGLGLRPDLRTGSDSRPASQTSLQVQPVIEQQFVRRDFGGMLAVSPDVVLAKEAFRQRSPSAIKDIVEPSTEAAIHLGLEFLARNQKPDGSWALAGYDPGHPLSKRQLNSDTAATGLVLLAFQGGGYNHRQYRYASQMKQAIDWLIKHQTPDGGLYLESDRRSDQACRMYSHGIATLALTEAYGMTQDPELKGPAQKAIDYLAKTQHSSKGGWRYFASTKKRSTDTSVSGWMMMAIQSAQLADLRVDAGIKRRLTQWLDIAADPNNPSTFRYNPYAVNSQDASRVQGVKPSPSMTSVGLLMRIYSGWDKNDPRLFEGTNYLLMQQMPNMTTRKTRDTYYWYYATQVLKHVGGEQWNHWNNTLRPMLINTQQRKGDQAGSWNPYEPVPDRWGAYGGRLYVTTMNLMSLEVRHRLLPLYRKTHQ